MLHGLGCRALGFRGQGVCQRGSRFRVEAVVTGARSSHDVEVYGLGVKAQGLRFTGVKLRV